MYDVLSPSLLAVARQQAGVFSSEQAYDHGHGQREIQRLRGHYLVSVRRGVYARRDEFASATPQRQHEMRVAALALKLEAPAVLSHQTAAQELGMALLAPDLSFLHVTRPAGVGSRREAGVVHHVAELPEDQVIARPGRLPVTSTARTAVDVGICAERFECALAAVDSALRTGATVTELAAALDLCRGWPGARIVSGAVALGDGRAENPGESWSRAVLVAEGLAPEDLQAGCYDDEGLIGYVDFRWKGVVGEFDGKRKYRVPVDGSPDDAAEILWREKRREDRLRVEHEVVRWGYTDLPVPGRIAGAVRSAMERAHLRGLR